MDHFRLNIMITEFKFPAKVVRIMCCLVAMLLVFTTKIIAQEPKDCCSISYTSETIKLVSLNELSREYRRLRFKKCEACLYWQSGLNQVLTELGQRLEGKNKATIKQVMGKPDEKKGNEWIYDWRNGHDYLYFVFIDGKASSNWYYAFE